MPTRGASHIINIHITKSITWISSLQSQHVLYMKKHKPLGPVAKSSFLSLSASVQSEVDGEVVSPFASAEKETPFYMLHVSLKWTG